MPKCELTGKSPVSKNLVSHSNIKTKSRSCPNIQTKRFFSYQLNESIRLKVATTTLKTIDKQGQFDDFLLRQDDKSLSSKALKMKKRILKKTNRSQKPQENKA